MAQWLCASPAQPGHSGARHSSQSCNTWQEDTFFPTCVCQLPHTTMLAQAVEMPGRDPPTASWDGQWQSTGRELAVCLWHRQVKSGLPHPHAVSPHCRAGQKRAPSFSMDLTAAQPCPGTTRDRQTYNLQH